MAALYTLWGNPEPAAEWQALGDCDLPVDDACDNCPFDANADQADGDGIGDACDVCPDDPDNDLDGDGLCGDVDPCPADPDNLCGGGGCDLGEAGDPCDSGAECCSDSCKGKPGSKTCK